MAVDKVKPLKIENPALGGTETDLFPTEADPSEDFLAAKGLALENSDDHRVEKVGNEVAFADPVSGSKKVSDLLDAEQENFDPLTSGLVSTKSGPAIRELANQVSTSASPGFGFGRSGNVPSGTWLLRTGSVPSNKTGVTMGITNPVVFNVDVANENVSTFDVEIYEHEGDETNLTLLGTVSVVASRTGSFSVSWAATSGRQLAVKLSSGSAKNPGVDVTLSGST